MGKVSEARVSAPIMRPETIASIGDLINDHADRAASYERAASHAKSVVGTLHALSEASAHRFMERAGRAALERKE